MMETVTLWSHQAMFDSCFTETEPPCPQGTQHLPTEAFTLDSPILESSLSIVTQVGIYAPCTKSVYKAAHRRIRLAKSVSPSVAVAPLLAIANPPGTKSIVSNSFCDFHLPSSPTPDLRQCVILNGFSGKGLNKLAYALNSNHISWQIPVPRYRSKQCKSSFSIPNGMIVFDYAFYGKDKLWLKYYRRGLAYKVDTHRSASPRLYGTMLRSVASFGGGPGSRWTYFRSFKPFWNGPSSFSNKDSPGSAHDIYEWNHLRYEGFGPDDIYVSDVDDGFDDNGSHPPISSEEYATSQSHTHWLQPSWSQPCQQLQAS